MSTVNDQKHVIHGTLKGQGSEGVLDKVLPDQILLRGLRCLNVSCWVWFSCSLTPLQEHLVGMPCFIDQLLPSDGSTEVCAGRYVILGYT